MPSSRYSLKCASLSPFFSVFGGARFAIDETAKISVTYARTGSQYRRKTPRNDRDPLRSPSSAA
jgi:hypothetical protein